MAQIKAGKLQSRKTNNQFLNTLIIHFISASTCFLLCTYPYLFPSLQHLAPIFLPRIYSMFSDPKFVFFIVNIIVAFLVKESNLLNPPSNNIYDDYIKTSQRTKRVSSRHVQEKIEDNYHKRVETTKVVMTEKKNSIRKCGDSEVKTLLGAGKANSKLIINPNKHTYQHEKDQSSRNLCKKEKGYEKEENGLPADELNKRADAFIARVNRRRLLETKGLVCSKA